MSYDLTTGKPDGVEFVASSAIAFDGPANLLVVFRFMCPRCGSRQAKPMNANDLIYGFEAECTNPACVAPGERFGYQIMYFPQWEVRYLSLNDRPLHEAKSEGK